MNETTLFFSRLIGPVLAVVGLSFILRRTEMIALMKQLVKNNVILWIYGMIELTAGIAIILAHNEWSSTPAIIISLIGWGMILEGSFGVLSNKTHIKRMMGELKMGLFSPSGVIMLLAGACLVWNGYLAAL